MLIIYKVGDAVCGACLKGVFEQRRREEFPGSQKKSSSTVCVSAREREHQQAKTAEAKGYLRTCCTDCTRSLLKRIVQCCSVTAMAAAPACSARSPPHRRDSKLPSSLLGVSASKTSPLHTRGSAIQSNPCLRSSGPNQCEHRRGRVPYLYEE